MIIPVFIHKRLSERKQIYVFGRRVLICLFFEQRNKVVKNVLKGIVGNKKLMCKSFYFLKKV